jgi:hypothetical protein
MITSLITASAAPTALVLGSTSASWACAVCTDPTDPRSNAYFDMTMFLSLLPLAALGFVSWWLYRQYSAAALD